MSNFLKSEFQKNNFTFSEIEDILIINDFISKNEVNVLIDIINNTAEEEWYIHYRSTLKDFCMEKFGRDDVENLVAEGKYEITKGWDDKNLSILNFDIEKILSDRLHSMLMNVDPSLTASGFYFIQRMQEGVELKAHTDQHTDPSIRYAAVLYLNDNYNGGEIFWTNKNIEMKPKSGSLVIFPGDKEYDHGVRHVKPGPIRYVLPAFIKIKDFYKDNKY